ncbi:MAG TPA: glycosyltransferase [Bacteroidales bacterium]|nr:glycosyltransferase [Bacteroidales bacterium]HRZ49669.1 glycosyltransferase [Bacteroidales bacterium]
MLPGIKTDRFQTPEGVDVRVIRLTWILSPLVYTYPQLQWILFHKAIQRAVRELRPDLIHGHVIHPAGALAGKIARHNNLPLLITEHWSNLEVYVRKRIRSDWGRKAYQYSSFILPVSDFLKRSICDAYPAVTPEKVVVVPNIVYAEHFTFHAKPAAAGPVLKFIMVSAWVRYKQATKRPDIVIKALGLFAKNHHKDISLTVVGDGDMLPEMKTLVAENGIRATFTGFLPSHEIARLMHEHNYFVHASEIETFSVVTAEAMMCGLPVVVSDTGALPELVTVDRGVVTGNTIEEWEEAIQKVTSKTFNCQTIAAEVAEYCSPGRIGHQIYDLYTRCRK